MKSNTFLNNYLSARSCAKMILESEKNTAILTKHLNDNKGNGKFNFEIGQSVYDIITYKNAIEGVIVDRYLSNGHDKYVVNFKNEKYNRTLRAKDLILK